MKFKTLVLSASLLFSQMAMAGLIGINDTSVIGNGNAATDGNNLTLDTVTNLQWLDVTLSTGVSYDFIEANAGAGQVFGGFRHATLDEVTQFVTNAGFVSINTEEPANQTAAKNLQELIGVTNPVNPGSWERTLATYDSQLPFAWATDLHRTASISWHSSPSLGGAAFLTNFSNMYDDQGSPDIGHFLVRTSSGGAAPTDEPGILMMLFASLLAFSSRRKVRARG